MKLVGFRVDREATGFFGRRKVMTQGLVGEPEIVRREQQPHAAIRSLFTMDQIGDVLPSLHSEVAASFRARGVEKAGAPFF